MTEQPTVTDGVTGAAAAPIAEPTTITTWRDSIDVDPLAADMPPISPEDFAELVADIKERGIVNEVTVYRDADGRESILDGCTRLDAAERAGLPIIKDGALNFDVVPHRYVDGNVDREKYVRSQNLLRKHFNSKQKRLAIAKLLKAQPEQSNRSIAHKIGADDKTVASERAKLEARAEIPNTGTRQDKTGRRQPARKPKSPSKSGSKSKLVANQPASTGSADAGTPVPITSADAAPVIPDDWSIPETLRRAPAGDVMDTSTTVPATDTEASASERVAYYASNDADRPSEDAAVPVLSSSLESSAATQPTEPTPDLATTAAATVNQLSAIELQHFFDQLSPAHKRAFEQKFGQRNSDNTNAEIATLARECTALLMHAAQNVDDIRKKLARIRKLTGCDSKKRSKTTAKSNARLDTGALARCLDLAGQPGKEFRR